MGFNSVFKGLIGTSKWKKLFEKHTNRRENSIKIYSYEDLIEYISLCLFIYAFDSPGLCREYLAYCW